MQKPMNQPARQIPEMIISTVQMIESSLFSSLFSTFLNPAKEKRATFVRKVTIEKAFRALVNHVHLENWRFSSGKATVLGGAGFIF